ncbi:IS630 family transposase [Spirosoma spitsbergense]|uniref:IS630 family transposase n=1 Tax=Spirosoma spitsbergense TaxID=431554 RepID=UPI000361B364|nr:IS630 family transposase [Spirosoma spitsbergense]
MLVQLDDSQRQLLRQLQKTESAKRDYVKITAILMLDRGKDPDEVADLLGIDHTTVYRYAQSYRSLGLQEYLGDSYRGWWGRLDSQQLSQLQAELRRGFYTSAQMVADWIQTTFSVSYHPQGLVKLLHRLGFAYKKTTLVAPKADPAKQVEFVAQLQRQLSQLAPDEVVYFADAVHPQHNTRPAQGWIEVGQQRPVACNSSRYRLNINAVVNGLNPVEVIARQDKTIDSFSTIALLEQVLGANAGKRIHVYCDSARYYVSKQVAEWVASKPITLHFLPGYSPNLNPIERLWKFMRQKVIDSTYYPDFALFEKQVMAFLGQLEPYRVQLERLLVLRFAIVNKDGLIAV